MTARYAPIFVTALSLAALALSLAQPRIAVHACPVSAQTTDTGVCVSSQMYAHQSHIQTSSSSVCGHARAKLCVYVHDTSAVYTMFVCGCSCVGVRCALTRLYLTLERLCGACVRCCDVIPVEGGRGNDS